MQKEMSHDSIQSDEIEAIEYALLTILSSIMPDSMTNCPSWKANFSATWTEKSTTSHEVLSSLVVTIQVVVSMIMDE
jgi:hypothetical protein